MYISTGKWRDLSDHHLYHEGDPFPFDGRAVDKARLAELESGKNQAGLKLIRAVEAKVPEKAKEAPEAETKPEAQPEEKAAKAEEPKKATRSRKK